MNRENTRVSSSAGGVETLRKRAETPVGKIIIERTTKQLEGPFTTWHAAGYAFLYQVTADKSYAAKAREYAEQTIAGKGNPDPRYTWPGNGQLRAWSVSCGCGDGVRHGL